jgi:small-conductance mechanosensitive channel
MKRTFLLYVLLLSTSFVSAGGLIEKASQQLPQASEIFVGFSETKAKQLTELKQEKVELDESQKEFEARIKEQIAEASAKLTIAKDQMGKEPDNAFLSKKILVLNEIYQVLQDVQYTRSQLRSLLDDVIKLLSDYFDDPELDAYKKEHKLYDRLYYSFEDLQRLNDKARDLEQLIVKLTDQEKNVKAELEGRKRSADLVIEQAKTKQEAWQKASKGKALSSDEEAVGDVQKNVELLELEDQLFTHKKLLSELQIRESKLRIDYVGAQLFIASSKYELLKDYLRRIKPSVRVSEADIAYAKEEFDKWKRDFYSKKEGYRKEIIKLRDSEKKKETRLKKLAEKYNLSLGRELDEWSKEPAQTVDSHLIYCDLGALNSELLLERKRVELIDAQIAIEDETYNYEKLKQQVKESYHKIGARKLTSDEQVTKEVKLYEIPLAESKAQEARYRDKINVVADQLSAQKKALDNIERYRQNLQQLRDTLFKGRQKDYARCLDLLRQSEVFIKKQIDVLSKLTGAYSSVTSVTGNINRLIAFIKKELEAITIWHRPEYAITWKGVKSIPSDVAIFLSDIRVYFARFSFTVFVKQLFRSFRGALAFLIFIMKILLLMVLLLFFRRLIPLLNVGLMRVSSEYAGSLRFISLFVVLLLSFFRTYFWSVLLWILFYAALSFHLIPDPYVYVFFYLASIPCLLYLAYCFNRFMVKFNVQHDYVFFAEDFQRRFILVFGTLTYATISIFFFREAFMLANYYHSELPTILLAVNFIIFQITLIFLITKEQILNLIPTWNNAWLWIRDQVDHYYYLLLLMIATIIIMSNPYVGFGRLVLYALFGLLYTGLLLFGLIWVHALFKRIASHVFFQSDDDRVRERFSNAKTWFGLLIIVAFLLFTVLGLVVGARIWGWHISFEDVTALINEPIIGKGTASPITTVSLLQIIAFILAGALVSYGFNRFVLDKIFDLLLVDTGVQHTVTSIMQYLIIIIAVFIGFQSVGLGQLVSFLIGALALSLGWVLKDPISDFVAYFIILVQRPIKIGDYVRIDAENMGVVRKITARSVVLRRKNSTTIIVPNSVLTGNSVTNWNYARSFIAFDDIHIIIDYKEDPLKVKDLLREVVSEHPSILKNPQPVIRLDNFGEYGYEFMVRAFVSSVYTLEQWNVASDVRLGIVKKLRENNIDIALPIRLLKTRKDNKGDV